MIPEAFHILESEVELHWNNQCQIAEEFLSRYILDDTNTFITGGVFARLFHNLPIKDIDVFIKNSSNFDQIKQLYMNDSRFTLLESRAKHCKFAIAGFDYTLDLVGFTNRANSEDLIRKFDFTITRFKYENGRLSAFERSDIEDLYFKKLKYTNNVLFTTSRNNTLTRAERYRQLGFSLDEDFYVRVSADLLRMINRNPRRRIYATPVGPVSEETLLSSEVVVVDNQEEVIENIRFDTDSMVWRTSSLSPEEELVNYNPPERAPLQIETQNIPESSPSFDGSMESIERLIV